MKIPNLWPWSRKESATNRVVVAMYSNGAVFSKRDYALFAKEGYQQNATVFACVSEIADAVGSIPLKLYRTRGANRKEITDQKHPLLALLRKPNPEQGQSDFMVAECSYRLLSGNSYIESAGPLKNMTDVGGALRAAPLELYTLRPDQVKIVKGAQVKVAGYQYGTSVNPQKIDATRILHRKSFNPLDDYYGQSPLEAGAMATDTDNAAQKWNFSLLMNEGRPSGVLVFKGSLSEEQENKIRQRLQERHSGPDNAGGILVLEEAGEGDVGWKQVSINPADLDWANGRKMSKKEICTVFKVPPEMIGDSDSKTYSNYQEARKAFYSETVLPYIKSLLHDLNSWLVPMFGTDLELDYDHDSIEAIQEDRKLLWELAQGAWKCGLVTANEARAMVKMGEANDAYGDIRFLPLGMVPVTDMGFDDEQSAANVAKFVKSVNLNTEELKSSYWKAMNVRRRGWVNRASKMFEVRIRKDLEAAAAAIEKASGISDIRSAVVHAVGGKNGEWAKTLRTLYMILIPEFAQPVREQILKSMGGWSRKDTENDEAASAWGAQVQSYLGSVGGQKISQISATTVKQIMAAIEAGVALDESIPDLAKRIREMEEMEKYRAVRIARTEVVSASNFGSLAGAKSTKLPLIKEWISTRDGDTRDGDGEEFDHLSMDGKTAALDEPFVVDGEEMLFPGDSTSASAGNLINCRCTVAYRVQEMGE